MKINIGKNVFFFIQTFEHFHNFCLQEQHNSYLGVVCVLRDVNPTARSEKINKNVAFGWHKHDLMPKMAKFGTCRVHAILKPHFWSFFKTLS